MRGGIFAGIGERGDARARRSTPSRHEGRGLRQGGHAQRADHRRRRRAAPHVVAIDTGIKRSIIENLVAARRASSSCTRATRRQRRCSPATPTSSSSPTAPATRRALDYVVENVRQLIGKKPVFGICLGHQLLCRAVGLETYKLPFGHRGANHPVKDLETGKIDITSQNHGFAVQTPDGTGTVLGDEPVRWETDFGAAELSPRQSLRPHGRGPGAATTSRAPRSSTTRRPARDRTTRSTSSTASWSWQ